MFTKHCWNNNKNTSLTNKIASNNQKNWWFWKIVQLFYLLCHKCLILFVSKFVSLTAQFEGINHSLSETKKEFHIPLISLKRLGKKSLFIHLHCISIRKKTYKKELSIYSFFSIPPPSGGDIVYDTWVWTIHKTLQ